MTFAIAHKDAPKKVLLWCEGTPEKFRVINGDWWGTLIDRVLHVIGPPYLSVVDFPDHLVAWKGKCPKTDYNEAIHWIEEQL